MLDIEKNEKISASEEHQCGLSSPSEVKKTSGVAKIELVKSTIKPRFLWIFALSIFLTCWVATLDSLTTFNYQPFATSSFNRHLMLLTLTIATLVISAVSKPFIAKISDLSSRPAVYVLVLVLYCLGFVILACLPTIAAFVIGTVFISIGQSGVNLMNNIIVADMTPLKWRGFVNALMSTPYLVTTWVSGYIINDIVSLNWRWGYGMFAIISPVALAPAILIMVWLDRRAQKEGKISFSDHRNHEDVVLQAWATRLRDLLIEIDAIGLILLGFAFSLLLLPFSLYEYAKGGLSNPSMIAMIVVGGVLLIAYVIYECWFAPFPLLPRRVLLNRTFICCVMIDVVYQFGGYLPLLYFSSYTMAVLNLSIRDWTYLSNTYTMGLCFFAIIWGLLFRIYHRYKLFQVYGICIKLIGMGIYVKCAAQSTPPSLGTVVAGLIVTSLGDSASVMGTQVAAQAAVPHQDMAATISVLSLYSSIGAALGSAVTSLIWSSKMPKALLKYVGNQELAASFYTAVTDISATPWNSAPRLEAIHAYQEVNHLLFSAGLGISSAMLIGAILQTNFYLGDNHNCVEGVQEEEYDKENEVSVKTFISKFVDFIKHPIN